MNSFSDSWYNSSTEINWQQFPTSPDSMKKVSAVLWHHWQQEQPFQCNLTPLTAVQKGRSKTTLVTVAASGSTPRPAQLLSAALLTSGYRLLSAFWHQLTPLTAFWYYPIAVTPFWCHWTALIALLVSPDSFESWQLLTAIPVSSDNRNANSPSDITWQHKVWHLTAV